MAVATWQSYLAHLLILIAHFRVFSEIEMIVDASPDYTI